MKVFVFGATGSIGQQSLNVIKKLGYDLVGYTYHSNDNLSNMIDLEWQGCKKLCTKNLKKAEITFNKILQDTQPDIVINAITGFDGLKASQACINNKINIALANKESLVVAGNIITKLVKQNDVKVLPIDSEHSALMQLFYHFKKEDIKQMAITASGGRYFNASDKELKKVSYNDAINHPKWNMGPKISIDSATLINKYFELIEAHWYFPHYKISALYHPEVKIHALVETTKGWFAQTSANNMEISIELALTNFGKLEQTEIIKIDNFKKPFLLESIDEERHLPIKWFNEILKKPETINTVPIVINAANEYAQDLFKKDIITFDKIIKIISWAKDNILIEPCDSFEEVYKRHISIVSQLKKEFE